MASYGMNDVKNGAKIIVDGHPCVIIDTDFIKPGKGQAFTRVKYRNIKTGRVVELTMKSTDTVEAADVVDTDMQFLYADGEFWHFMQQETIEQVQADKAAVGDNWQWLKGEEDCVVTLWNGAPIAIQPPNFVERKIVKTDPGVRGDRSEEHTSELQSLMRISYAVFCLKKKNTKVKYETKDNTTQNIHNTQT